MKILLSAYACEPNKGSEPGVGWNWAVELSALGHQVWVITRTSNRTAVEAGLKELNTDNKPNFIFVDLPEWCVAIKDAYRSITYHVYYLLWQVQAFFTARQHHKQLKFDQVHHVTYVSIRQPSLMGLLGIPFIFGPVSGGETIPSTLRKGLLLKGILRDWFRDLVNAWVKFDPLLCLTFLTADKIVVSSKGTQELLPKWAQSKSLVQLAIGTDPKPLAEIAQISSASSPKRFLHVGNFVYFKGAHLALAAFSLVLKQCPDASLTIVGSGDEGHWIKAEAKRYGVYDQVQWLGWMSQPELFKLYSEYDVFLFPSLRDSGGMVVLEALERGLPVICLDLGGPGVVVDESCGYAISTKGADQQTVVNRLTEAMLNIMKTTDFNSLKQNAVLRAGQFQWKSLVKKLYS